ncbi:hypothetical protein MMC26_000338 [Xylographa opegraphella]|nr:hypothetical protein [Xylographa opegraphella]
MHLLSVPAVIGIFGLLMQASDAYPSALLAHRDLTQTIHITIDTPIPSNVFCTSVLAIVHSPVKMILLNPLVESYTLNPDVTPITYTITDKLLMIFTTTYTATFTNRADGMDTVSNAAGGLVLDGHWTVAQGELKEEIDVTGNALELPFVRRMIESSHQQLHTALIAEAGEGGA